MQHRQLPAAGGPQRDAPAPGAPDHAADHQQPGVEDRGGVGPLDVLEERRVHRAGRVVEGQEDHPATGPDRRGLGGHLDPGDEHLGGAAGAEQVGGPGHPDRVEEPVVERHHVPARVQPEDLQLGADPLGVVHLGQPADLAVDRGVTEVEGELHRGDRGGRPGRLRLPRGLLPHPCLRRLGCRSEAGSHGWPPGRPGWLCWLGLPGRSARWRSRARASELLLRAASWARPAAATRPPAGAPRLASPRPRPLAARSTARACRSRSATWSSRSRRVTPAAAADPEPRGRRPDAVDAVEPAGQHQPLERPAGRPARGARSR